MYTFGNRSMEAYSTLHPLLQELMDDAIKLVDFAILEGRRDKKEQDLAFGAGMSRVKYPNSKHNTAPSHAVDVAPYPIDWKDESRFAYLAGIIMGLAKAKGIKIRWGGDWDSDGVMNTREEGEDRKVLNDLVHFELVDV